ncbi:PIG-X [Amylocystis lapponica]|nr:PIG-X [Amylocystis lapponica]
MSLPTSSLSSVIYSQGFHFTCTSTFDSKYLPDHQNCTLHLLHILPPDVYADQYELAQRPGFTSALRGTTDIELPVVAVAAEHSVLLLDVDRPSRHRSDFAVDVPLHLRYARSAPSAPHYHTVLLPLPIGFWTCPSPGAEHVLPKQLSQYISPDMYPSSKVYLVSQIASAAPMSIPVPVGRLDDLAVVDVGTASVMLLMLAYLAVVSSRTARRLHARTSKQE